ncbi:MAG: hypothetical protein ACFFAH_04910 [Promethearchaeota archaeon]
MVICCATLLIINIFGLYKDSIVVTRFIWSYGYIFAFLCVSYSLKVIYKAYRLTRDKATFIELLSFTAILLVSIISIILYTLVFIGFSVSYFLIGLVIVFWYIFMISGLFTILTNYLVHKNYMYRLPFPIHQIMVINRGGNLAYVRKVYPLYYGEHFHMKDEIISALFKALSSMIHEFLGKEIRLKYVDIGKYQIYFSQIPNQDGIILVITSGGSMILQKSLDRFASSISKNLLEKINDPNIRSDDFRKIFDKYVLESFPYLKINNI